VKLRPDVGQLTAGGMLFGILFGWGVLYLTRDEARTNLADLDARVEALERVNGDALIDEMMAGRKTEDAEVVQEHGVTASGRRYSRPVRRAAPVDQAEEPR
jgi:hypothetical protein